MALKRENYTLMGMCILLYVCTILSLSAQEQACPIWADLEPIAAQTTATPTVYSQSVSIPFYDWEQLDSSRYSDDQYATVTLPGINRSEMAIFSRWGHQIPEGAIIHGIRVDIEGHQTGGGSIRDVKVQLQGSNENKASDYLGIAYPDSIDQVWRYGGANDTWGRSWTANQINRSNFGLIYQVRNAVNSETTLHIDQISIEVFYTPIYTVCNDEHICVAFGVDEIPGYSYNWDIPQGFERLSSLNELYAVNVGPSTANFGQYSICVDVFDENGEFAENCCRSFKYEDCRPAFIGDQVFLDQNHDNINSSGDLGVEGVKIYLFDEFDNQIAFTLTDENGNYQFEVSQGNYYAVIDLPDGMLPIEANIGSDNVDSDLDNSNGPLSTATFFAAAGSIIENIDIGLAIELRIGDQVWEDKVINGIRDDFEEGIPNIEVLLIATNGDTLLSTTTDATGNYTLDGIRVDDYEVQFIAPDEYQVSLQNIGTEDLDSDINESGSTVIIDFDALDMPYLDLDAAYYRFASVGDFVFFDQNENGIQDTNDTPQDSVLVTLSTASGVVIKSVLTDDSGIYLFDSLVPGPYVITAAGSELIKPTFALQGSDITIDNDLHNENGIYTTSEFMLMSNEMNNDIDLGFRDNLADLGGLVFEDIKYDGQFDDDDILLSNIMVLLKSMDGEVVQSKTTDSDGTYLFMNVSPGSYYITFEIESQLLFTQANLGDEATDSDVTDAVELGSTDMIAVVPGLEQLDLNAGVYRNTSIGDFVFLDLNEDGVQNNGDTGLQGIELILLDASGSEVAIDTSDANGAYLFDGLVPGEYSINLVSSDLYLATIEGEGSSETDSDLMDINGSYVSPIIATCSGQEIDTIDFGFINNYATLSGQLFEDSKATGLFNVGDTLLSNISAMLYNVDGELIQSVSTDTLGNYTIENVLAGDYYIVYNLPSNYIFSTSDITLSNGVGSTDVFTLAPGEVLDNLLTGAYIPASVGDFVFLDLNEDGVQNDNDEGLQGLTLELRDNSGALVSTLVSAEDGSYIFDSLIPGNYVINFIKDDLFLPTLSNVGEDDEDSDLLEVSGLYTSGSITLCSGQQVDTIDFGFINNYAQISGQVFEDSKADGEFDNLDTSIVNVMISLLDSQGTLVQNTETDSLGNFQFENILAGDYYIIYGLSDAYIYSTNNVTESNGQGSTDVFTLAPGEDKNNEITGAYIPGTIGDFVFLDNDEDGIQGVNDSGLADISLTLLNADGEEVKAATSDADGSYSFIGLVPGDYSIQLTNSDLYLSTLSNVGDDNLDSDLEGVPGNYTSPSITICSGQTDNTIDFGFIIDFATITGQVFEDSKADEIFDMPDTALIAVPVILYNSSDQEIQSTMTDSEGNYTFEDVLPGDYYLVYGLEDQYFFSTGNITNANGDGSTDVFTLLPGEMFVDQTTGAYIPGAIGDYVFLDLNENGIQDEGDEALADVMLSLINGNGGVETVFITDADGAYLFEGLVPGDYIISILSSELYLPTQANIGDPALDSDLQTLMGNYGSNPITICSGQDDLSIDFGFVNNYTSISGQVYEDSKADSLFNDIDTTIANVTVTLFSEDNSIVQTTTTDANGNYSFTDVLAGTYYIVYGLDDSYIYTSAEVTGTNGDGSTDNFTLQPGEVLVNTEVGSYRNGSIGNFVFLDLNENGIQNTTDNELEGIALSLFDLDGNALASINSGVDGSYTFDNLSPGQYVIRAISSDLYLPTLPNVGDDNLDSDLQTSNGLLGTDVITICSGQQDESIDFGFINNYANITGSVFEDAKANAIFDEPDTIKVGVAVELYNTDNQLIQTTTTAVDGSYNFENVLAGDYYIIYNLSSNYIFSTMDVTNANGDGSTDIFTLAPGAILSNQATGAYRNGSIGNLVFLDNNDDGIQDNSDAGLEGIALTLFDETGTNQEEIVSDENGNYSFDNITPGKYIIQLQFDDIYIPTLFQQGDEDVDSDLQNIAGFNVSDTINICSGQMIENVDFGLANNYAKIGGVVFTDLMRDGQLMVDDELLEGIPVTLYNTSGEEVATRLTDENGAYLFENILAGDYYVIFAVGDQLFTLPNEGDDATDSDVTESNGDGSTDVFALAPGECNLTISAGVFELSSIGDFVWSDDNRNGLQDAGEPGIENVVVNLYDENDQLIATDNTNVDGIYGFEGLNPGMYYIEIEYPQDLTRTQNVSSDLSLNSDLTDANGEGTTDDFALISGTDNLDIDAGLGLAGAEIHGEVWLDIDGDEMQSSSDQLLSGIPVKLFNALNDQEESSTVTNQNGSYTFKPVDDGTYYVRFDITDTLVFVTPAIGSEDVDSDADGSNGIGTTEDITVTIGDVITNVDAGVEDGRSQISGEVFIDKNGDGFNEDTEVNLEAYTVNLHAADGTIVKSVMANADGTYLIEDVGTGMYYLTFEVASDYEFTIADVATDDTIDSDVTESIAMGSTELFTLGIQDAQVYDAGVFILGSIGDFVWFDTDGNGLQDDGEPGVEFANLTILDMAGEAVDIANTAADGAYLFDGLAPGRYWIFMQAPLGLKATTYQEGTDSEIDSDLLTDGAFLLSDTIMIMSGQNDLSIDFGLVENPGSIEGFVWNDIDADGIFNDNINSFEAVTVELYTADGTLESSTNTDPDGGYIFNDVSPNDYYIRFVLNDDTTFTEADQGGDDDVDSDVTSGANGEGTTETFTLNTGQAITNIYAGLIFPAKIGNFVFLDQNSDGIQDAGEPGLPMLKVILFDATGMRLDSVLTDLEGLYTFNDLDPGSYYLEFEYPEAIQPTITLAGMPEVNSDITEANGVGTTDIFFLGSGECNEDIDGGFVPTGAVITGEVWLDTDNNFIQDNPNTPVEGIEIFLYSTTDVDTPFAGPVFSNELGIYGFSSIPTGSYFVEFNIPDTLDFVTPNVGPADTDSDVTGFMGPGRTSPFIVLNGELYQDVDAGVTDIRSTVNGQLFIDADGDGVKDSNNMGLEGADVKLLDDNGIVVASTITDADGMYLFEGILAGTYNVEFSNYPSTYQFTTPNVGNDNTDSDVVVDIGGIGLSAPMMLNLDETQTVDGGIFELASIGDYVWIDENEDGIQQSSEMPQQGVLVEVLDAAMMVAGSSTSDQDGMYLVEDLVPGEYSLRFTGLENYVPTIANQGDDILDSDIIEQDGFGVTGTFALLSGEINLDFDGGFVFAQPADAVISGVAWADSDGNGIREGSNPLLENVAVILFDNNGLEIKNTVTDANGAYSFTELSDGQYYVVFEGPIGTSPTIPNVGSDLTDSDITGGNTDPNSTDIINLGPSEIIENIDGGFISVGAIGDQIFVDVNGNGRRGSNEPGLNGVTVKLHDAGTGALLQTVISEPDAVTMEDGFYRFNSVPLGSYYIVFELPEPYLFTDADQGTDDEKDSDVTGMTNGPGSTETFSIASGQIRTDIDAGGFLPAQLGDFVWDDLDEDGVQDAGEPGIANIAVSLRRSNGLLIASTTTNSDGFYCFDGLKQGLYFAEFEVPNGYVASPMNIGDSDTDSDADETGVTPLFSLAHGFSLKNVDAGFFAQNTNNLRSHVWFDEDGDGLFEFGESMIKDVEITLLNDQGAMVAQTMTNQAGRYSFVDIPIGEYQVAVGVDDGFATTTMNAGNDDMIDSDVNTNGMSAMFTVNNGLSVPNIDIGLIDDDGIAPEVTSGDQDLLQEDLDNDINVSDPEEVLKFTSGPNPFYNRVQVRMNKLVQGVEYNIIRLDGGLVQKGSISEKSQWIELEHQVDGMYILIVTHKGVPVDKQYLMKVN